MKDGVVSQIYHIFIVHLLILNPHLALAVVVRTGDHTFIGQIAHLTGGESGNRSPLAVEIDHFVHIISVSLYTTLDHLS